MSVASVASAIMRSTSSVLDAQLMAAGAMDLWRGGGIAPKSLAAADEMRVAADDFLVQARAELAQAIKGYQALGTSTPGEVTGVLANELAGLEKSIEGVQLTQVNPLFNKVRSHLLDAARVGEHANARAVAPSWTVGSG